MPLQAIVVAAVAVAVVARTSRNLQLLQRGQLLSTCHSFLGIAQAHSAYGALHRRRVSWSLALPRTAVSHEAHDLVLPRRFLTLLAVTCAALRLPPAQTLLSPTSTSAQGQLVPSVLKASQPLPHPPSMLESALHVPFHVQRCSDFRERLRVAARPSTSKDSPDLCMQTQR